LQCLKAKSSYISISARRISIAWWSFCNIENQSWLTTNSFRKNDNCHRIEVQSINYRLNYSFLSHIVSNHQLFLLSHKINFSSFNFWLQLQWKDSMLVTIGYNSLKPSSETHKI
jgi:hypothetical protein